MVKVQVILCILSVSDFSFWLMSQVSAKRRSWFFFFYLFYIYHVCKRRECHLHLYHWHVLSSTVHVYLEFYNCLFYYRLLITLFMTYRSFCKVWDAKLCNCIHSIDCVYWQPFPVERTGHRLVMIYSGEYNLLLTYLFLSSTLLLCHCCISYYDYHSTFSSWNYHMFLLNIVCITHKDCLTLKFQDKISLINI